MRKGLVPNQATDLTWGFGNTTTGVASITKPYGFSGCREAGL